MNAWYALITPDTVTAIGRSGGAWLTACCLSLLFTPVVRSLAVRQGWIAKPREDRWGRRVVARLGGAAMFASFLLAVLLWVDLRSGVFGLLAGLAMVFLLGLRDDLSRMSPYTKLIAQLVIGCVAVFSGIRFTFIQWMWLSVPLSILWFVLVMNAFNLLDNMDGLAAGVGVIAAAFYVVHAALAGQWTIAIIAAILSGSSVGFLYYNFPPAKIFMGDSGSHLLGFGLAALPLIGNWRHSTQLLSVLIVPVFVLAVPIFDTCFVTIQRLLHRQHPFVGGTDHLSHRLAILGLSTRQAVLALYGVSGGLGLLSLASINLNLLPTATLWLVATTALVLFGRYLAKVNVYRLSPSLDAPPSVAEERSMTFITTMLLHKRRLVEILVDFCLVSSAYVFAYLLRFEGLLTGEFQSLIVQSLPLLLVIKLTCFAAFGLYRGVWRYMGLSDLMTLVKAVATGSLLSALALLYLWRFEGYSRALLLIDGMLCLLAVGGSRVLERLLDDWIRGVSVRGVPTLLVGAGDTGARVLRSIKYEIHGARRVVGFLDDDPEKRGSRIDGTPVLGGRGSLARTLDEHRVREVLIAINDPPGHLLEHIQACCQPRGVAWKVVTAGLREAL